MGEWDERRFNIKPAFIETVCKRLRDSRVSSYNQPRLQAECIVFLRKAVPKAVQAFTTDTLYTWLCRRLLAGDCSMTDFLANACNE